MTVTTTGWSMTTVFAVLIGIVAFSMFMGSRNPGRKPRTGWWGGLVVLLIVLSGILSITWLKRGVREERFADRRLWAKNIREEVQDQVRKGQQAAKEGIDQAMHSLKIAAEEAKARAEGRSRRGNSTIVTDPAPREPVVLSVELSKERRSQDKKVVERDLKEIGCLKVMQWVRERLPMKTSYIPTFLTPEFLEEARAFPTEINFTREEVERYPGSEEKDTLYGGSMEVLLSPVLQERLLDLGYQKLDEYLKDDKLMQQGVVAAFLGLGTLGAMGLGFVCSAHRWWTTRHEPVQQSIAP